MILRGARVLITGGGGLIVSHVAEALGPSDDDQPGLIRFKRDLGAQEKELRFLRYTPPGWPPERGAEVGRLLGQLTRLLTPPDVPDEVTERAGAVFYRLFA